MYYREPSRDFSSGQKAFRGKVFIFQVLHLEV
jgi:hypothetical protein